jgi:hypothetical protein
MSTMAMPLTVSEPIAVPVTVVEPVAVPVTVVSEPVAGPVAVPVMVVEPIAAAAPVPTPTPAVVFTPQMDERILRGLVEDEGGLLREMSEQGYPAAAVRARATRLGLTEQVVMRCRLAGTWPSMRECLGCEQRFLSTGTHHRLCKRCRPQR